MAAACNGRFPTPSVRKLATIAATASGVSSGDALPAPASGVGAVILVSPKQPKSQGR